MNLNNNCKYSFLFYFINLEIKKYEVDSQNKVI